MDNIKTQNEKVVYFKAIFLPFFVGTQWRKPINEVRGIPLRLCKGEEKAQL